MDSCHQKESTFCLSLNHGNSNARTPNGIRIIHQHITSAVAHCGIMVNTGSRDESALEQGMSHFIEHALFKETKKRKAFHI